MVPSSRADSQPSPTVSVFWAPAAAQAPRASASTTGQARFHTLPSTSVKKAMAAATSAVMMYA